MDLKVKILKYRFLLPFFGLALILFLAGFAQLGKYGVYGDDWGAATYLFAQNTTEAVGLWRDWGGELMNFRPLTVVLPVLWYWGYSMAGLAGVSFVMFLLQLLCGSLAYLVFKKYFNQGVAFFGSVLFVLFPTQSFYLWQVTSTYFLAMSMILVAVLLWHKGKHLLSLALVLLALLVNESVLGIYFIAVIPEVWTSWKTWWQTLSEWMKYFLPVLLLYIVIRVVMEHFHIGMAGGRTEGLLQQLNLIQYFGQFIKAITVNLFLAIPIAGWKIWYNYKVVNWFYVIAATGISSLVFWLIFKSLDKRDGKESSIHLLWFGLLLMTAGRYYGFFYAPSINILNLDSRHYFASSLGAAFVFIWLADWLSLRSVVLNRICMIACIGLIAFLSVYKISVQSDYIRSWAEAKKMWPAIVRQTTELGSSKWLIVDLPAKQLGRLVEVGNSIGDLRFMIPVIYGKEKQGFTSNYIQSIGREADNVCLESLPFYRHICVESDQVARYRWDGVVLSEISQIPEVRSPWTVVDKKLLNQYNQAFAQ